MTTTSEQTETETLPPKKSALRERMRRPIVEPKPDEVADQPVGAAEMEDDGQPQELAVTPEDAKELKAKYERLGLTKATKQLREDEDKAIVDWITGLAGDAPIKVTVSRREPKEFTDPRDGQRKIVGGLLRTYDRPVDEQELQKNHGGGSLQLVVRKRDQHGGYKYVTARTVEIAGDPKFDDVPRTPIPQPGAPVPQGPSPLETNVMGRLVDGLLNQRNQPPPPMPDVSGAVHAAVQPFIENQRRFEQLIDRKDAELAAARRGNPEENSFRERLLEKFIDQDSARLQSVRAQYESEIRTLKEIAIANESRLREVFEREKDGIHRSHERELSNNKAANDLKVAALEQSFAVQKTVLESENRRLDREVTELRLEIKELRNKKEPSFKDQLSGIRDMKEMIADVVGDDGDDKEEKSTLVKVLEGAANSPIIAGFAEKVMAGAAGAGAVPPEVLQQQQAQQQAAQQQQRRRKGPRLIRDRRNGQVYATDGQKAIPVVRKQPLAAPPQPVPVAPVEGVEQPPPVEGQQPEGPVAAETQPEPVVEVPIPYVAPEHVAIATTYMTTAFGNSVPPADFVASVKMFIPQEIVVAIDQMGVEDFLRKVGGLGDDHALLSQGGRNWCRKVATLLAE